MIEPGYDMAPPEAQADIVAEVKEALALSATHGGGKWKSLLKVKDSIADITLQQVLTRAKDFDVIATSLFLHHLDNEQARALLGKMGKSARHLVLVNDLVHDGVGPVAKAAEGISIDSLKPTNGAINIEPLKTLTPAVGDLDDALTVADKRAAAIDTSDVVPQLKGPVAQVQSMLS